MPDYFVTWEIEITADSPYAAAVEARAIQRDPINIFAQVFKVDVDNRETINVDLSEPWASCQSCDWEGPIDELDQIKDFGQRVAAGETCPAGECPECGCLAHLTR